MSELKPCPFCGGKPGIKLWSSLKIEIQECNKCGASAETEIWNNRPYENKIKAEAVREFSSELRKHSELIMCDDGDVGGFIPTGTIHSILSRYKLEQVE